MSELEKDWKDELKLEVPNLYDIPIPKNILLNSIRSDKVRKDFEQFIETTKKKFITQYELPEQLVENYFEQGYIFSFSLNKNNKLFLHFNFSTYLANLSAYFESLNMSTDDYFEKIACGEWSEEDILNYASNKLKTVRKEIKDSKATNITHLASQCVEKYPIFLQGILKKYYEPLRVKFDLSDQKKLEIMRDGMSSEITKLIMNNRYLKNEIFDKEINFGNNIISTDHIKFYYNYYLLEKVIKNDKSGNNNAIYSVINYFQKASSKDNYPSFSDYTFKDFSKSLQEYLLQHKEVNMERFDDGFFDGWSAQDVDNYLIEFEKETLKKFEVIDPNSVFFPIEKKDEVKLENSNKTEKIEKENKSESLLSLKKRQFYADHNDKIYQCLMGKDEFKGHIAMVLKNGYVIFEKYDVKDENFSTKNGAAYIMTINNFNRFSKKSLTEVREYIRNQEEGIVSMDKITFRCHRGDWEEFIEEYFNLDTGIDLMTIQNAITSSAENRKKK